MSWFHFCTANHIPEGRLTLFDMTEWFTAGLRDLGHTVTISDRYLEPRAVNLLWDYFAPRFVDELARSGITYGLIATEIPDGNGFNWRPEPEWQNRFENFNRVAEGASFIWAQIESTMPYYARFAPTAFTALGFSERLVPKYVNETPTRDFCFFGLRTPYRLEAIERLRRRARVDWPEGILTHRGVAELIARSRIGISFKQSPQWPVPSPPRLGRLMLAKRGVAAEHVAIPTQQGEIVGLCPPDRDFVDYALDLLAGDWCRRAERVFEDYRQQMPMRAIMERALDESIGSANGSAAAFSSSARSKSAFPARPYRINRERKPRLVGPYGRFNLLSYNRRYYAVPAEFEPSFISPQEIEDFPPGCASLSELKRHIRRNGDAPPVAGEQSAAAAFD